MWHCSVCLTKSSVWSPSIYRNSTKSTLDEKLLRNLHLGLRLHKKSHYASSTLIHLNFKLLYFCRLWECSAASHPELVHSYCRNSAPDCRGVSFVFTMSSHERLRGACSCGRYRYIVDIPNDVSARQVAHIHFGNSSDDSKCFFITPTDVSTNMQVQDDLKPHYSLPGWECHWIGTSRSQ